jgi:NADH:ubiquinone oxidoreductase subunit 6 (subunit J)
VQGDFATAMQVVVYVMAGLMLAAFVVAVVGMPGGRVEEAGEPAGPTGQPGEATAASM